MSGSETIQVCKDLDYIIKNIRKDSQYSDFADKLQNIGKFCEQTSDLKLVFLQISEKKLSLFEMLPLLRHIKKICMLPPDWD